MYLEKFRSDFADSLKDRSCVLEISERGGFCYLDDIPIAPEKLLEAIDDPCGYGVEAVGSTTRRYEPCVHQVVMGTNPFNFGLVPLLEDFHLRPVEQPSLAEFLLAKAALSARGTEWLQESAVFISPIDCRIQSICHVIRECFTSPSPGAFVRFTASSFEERQHNFVEQERLLRHIAAAYAYFDTKYGFLEFYRALETLMLSAVFDELRSKFFSAPRRALEKASERVKNERYQLAFALQRLDALDLFEEMAAEIGRLRGVGNSFAEALEQVIDVSQDQPPSGIAKRAYRGIFLAYQIRCAIAHAGLLGLTIEDYSDALGVCEVCTPLIEQASLLAVGVTVGP